MAKDKDHKESAPFKKAVPVDMSETDIKKKEKRLVKALTERKKLKADAKEATATHRKGINDLDKEIDAIREQLEMGVEQREVMCVNVYDYRDDVVKTVRKDNRKVVETRAMTPEERQETFPAVKQRGAKPLPPGKAAAAARANMSVVKGDKVEDDLAEGGDDGDAWEGNEANARSEV